MRIRILVVDDHTLFREGLMALLSRTRDLEVIGSAANGVDAIMQATALLPDVILMDIQMPEMNGIEATQQILQIRPETSIIVLTMMENEDAIFAALCAGARGYILKGADKAEVLKTIRAVASGEALFGPVIARRLVNLFQSHNITSPVAMPASPFPDLSEREREILELIAQGYTNQEIAARLHITSKTVSNHISHIFNKLQVVNRAQAIVRARQAGLGEDRTK
ncbi:response regulator transcription factor [Caldilinea sp.]|jgi:DNA-binding NarL/FixJ family response regulator|uniref:response regulator transcription factor n=1 Tax=Caldilinea sp. TaxID=2293560 RepID=UPI001B165AAC|nr:response regulator transcription factor [Caldilinea sp.]MBO9394533.1 response regulator transcription factor [Caldilinea sp.]